MSPTRERRTFGPVVTASTWRTVWEASKASAARRRGEVANVPRLTGGDLASAVRAWLGVAGPERFPLWYQYGAYAYGWDPRTDFMRTTTRQRDAVLSDHGIAREFWQGLAHVADELDKGDSAPRIEYDPGVFDDPVFQGELRAMLLSDGAQPMLRHGVEVGAEPKKKPRAKIEPKKSSLLGPAFILGVLWFLFANPRERT